MIFKDFQKIQILNTSNTKGFRLADTKNLEMVQLIIEPWGEVAPHNLPTDVIFFVQNGTGILTIEEHSYELTNPDIAEVFAHQPRSWKNNSDKVLELLVIKQKAQLWVCT